MTGFLSSGFDYNESSIVPVFFQTLLSSIRRQLSNSYRAGADVKNNN